MTVAPDFYNDLVKSFSEDAVRASATSHPALINKGEASEGQQSQGSAFTYSRLMHAHFDGVKKDSIMKMIKSFAVNKLGTSDIGPLLVDTISPRMSFLRRQNTPLLNVIEMFSEGKDLVVDDWLYRIIERRLGNLRASRVNPEATLSTTTQQTTRQQKDNVLAFWGDPVTASWVASSQADQQRKIALMKQEVDAELERVRNAKNYDYWNGVKQTSFANNNITVVGGLLSRIVTNTLGVNGDIDNVTMEKRARILAAYNHPNTNKMIFAGDKQIDIFRTNESNRYNGNDSMSFLMWEREMGQKFGQYKVPYSRVYQFTQGPPAPICQDPDLDQSKIVILTLEPEYVPMEAKFKIGGVAGPFVFVRPTADLRDLEFVLEGATLDDPNEETRDLLTGLNVFS